MHRFERLFLWVSRRWILVGLMWMAVIVYDERLWDDPKFSGKFWLALVVTVVVYLILAAIMHIFAVAPEQKPEAKDPGKAQASARASRKKGPT